MSDENKAERIIAVLARIHRKAVWLTPEKVIAKCTPEELNFYYERLVEGK